MVMGGSVKILWSIVLVCCLIGIGHGIIGISSADSAIQQAAGAAIGIAWAVIPYCLVKAISMMVPRVVVVLNK